MKNAHFMDRRKFLQFGFSAGTGLLFAPLLAQAALTKKLMKGRQREPDDDHFFLMITLPNASGLDASYLWDARPLEMTSRGVIQNYRERQEPSPWTGSNGGIAQATQLVSPLRSYQSDFSVINGVLMNVGFDGHEQNINYLFTGDPFGGECFIPHLNAGGSSPRSLDAIKRGRYSVAEINGGQMVPLNPSAARSLISSLTQVPTIDPSTHLMKFLASRFTESFQPLADSFQGSASLSSKFNEIKTGGIDTDQGFIELAGEVFRSGVSKSAVLVLDPGTAIYDAHDPVSAAQIPQTYAQLVSSLSTIFAALKSTPYDSSRSLMDVTTVLFSAEFGRTLKQKIHPVENTGTDHNPLANFVLLAGKGIKGGQVIGSTDFITADETLSGAHLSLDPDRLKVMGRPFDFENSLSRSDLPANYHAADYLGFNSVVNTLYQLFGVPLSKWRLVERNGLVAPVIKGILSNL